MNKHVSVLVFFLLVSVIFYACEKDEKTAEQIERDKIIAVEDQLRDNTWKLIYFEEFQSREEAIKREKYFKSAAGRRFIKSLEL